MLGALAGALVSGGLSFFGQKKANKANEKSVDKQLAFQKESAQNSYQWATQDMKKAGINPMLAYQQGGSSALSGANYRASNALGAGAHSAQSASRITAELENLQSQNAKIQSDTSLNQSLKATAIADAALKASTAKQIQTQTQLIATQLPKARSKATAQKHIIGKGSSMIGTILENLGIKTPTPTIKLRRR